MTDKLQPIADAIAEVYPLGVAGDPYLCLMRVLDNDLDHLDDDTLAEIISHCFDMKHDWALRDLRRIRDIEGLDEEQCDEIRTLLRNAGLEI